MKNNLLRTTRVVFACLFFLLILLYFLGFHTGLPRQMAFPVELQLIPALLSVAVGTAVLILLFTLVFGRWYCSVLCPSGVLQDLFIRLRRKKGKAKRPFSYHKPQNVLRYSVLLLSLLLLLAGSNQLLSLLDPYSNFGRFAAQLFYPVVIGLNNLLAETLTRWDNYTLYHLSIEHIALSSLLIAIAFFLLLFLASLFRGRLFCNTLCPVGALLSVFSRFSFFRVRFDKELCNSCGLCARTCKAECIDSENKQVDASRCINCFNCLKACKKGGLSYGFAPFWLQEKNKSTVSEPAAESRRSFLSVGIGLLGSIPLLSACGRSKRLDSMPLPITPPGALDQDRFEMKCTACHLCVLKCPSKILKPAGMEYGFDYFLKPHMNYEKAYCNYECVVCTEVCPNQALKPLSVEEKVTTQLGAVHFDANICVVTTDEKDCGACSEHCPTQAVKMVPYKGDLRIPQIDPSICVGCGGCECICPVRPVRAIVVLANAKHKQVQKPEYEQVEEVEVSDFGF